MNIEAAKEEVRGLKKQGDRFLGSLAIMIRAAHNGFEHFGQLRLPEGQSIYASFREQDIVRTCDAPDIQSYQFKDSERILYVNITQDIRTKVKLLRSAGRRLGHSIQLVNELIDVVKGPEEQSLGI
jgi:hypothetical protein